MSPEKPEPADQADQGIKKVGQKTSTELTLTDETKLKSPEKLEPNSTTNNQPQTTTHSSRRTKRPRKLE